MLTFAAFLYVCPCGHGKMTVALYWMRMNWKNLGKVRCRGCGGEANRFELKGLAPP